MGYMRHHAIVVTGFGDRIVAAHEVARAIFADDDNGPLHGPPAPVTPLTDEVTNGYRSFAVLSDGSKDGWPVSDKGNAARDKLIAWLRKDDYCSWAEVQYGDEEHENKVLRHEHDGDGNGEV